ncbi:AAA family ATPase [Mangrovibacterium marinum]|uniref:AAA family ATPase n=1 Tax=Mangrovibacterium marinum TaxID=1639118 RepID=UPI002A18C551|nr:AAA family ATPase [Mangrovibacterium marinum]
MIMIYIKRIKNTRLKEERIVYPYNIPSVFNLEELEFHKSVTFIIGENGSGKSTLVEALAINAGFNPEGGSRNFNFKTQDSHSKLYNNLKLVRSAYRNTDGFFLRAESFYNVASEIDSILDKGQIERNYGGSLHERSHGESFLALVNNRLSGNGLYIFDEPESALSINSQFNLLIAIKELVEKQSQFIIVTHSPILMAFPDADIYHISKNGLELIDYENTEQYRLTKYFLDNHRRMIKELGLL